MTARPHPIRIGDDFLATHSEKRDRTDTAHHRQRRRRTVVGLGTGRERLLRHAVGAGIDRAGQRRRTMRASGTTGSTTR
ncbi:MAG: hypothetical protein R2856_26465 [Caldilineaceae bacterium]